MFGVPYSGPLIDSYDDSLNQREMVVKAFLKIFNFDMNKFTISIQDVANVVGTFEYYLFRRPFNLQLLAE